MAGFEPRGGRQRGDFVPRDREAEHQINDAIRAREVRLVGDNIGESRILATQEALRIAQDMDMDLVLIVPDAEPPVCRVVDYQKFLYQQRKRLREQKANAQKIVVKEIRFGPNTDDHDYEFKLKHAINFLQDGAKVKAQVYFKGRSIVFKDQGEMLLLRFAKDLEEYAKVDQLPQLEGKRMTMFFSPIKAGKKKS